MQPGDLRIAMFSGNYNYVRDGANQALNRLVDYLLRRGAEVRIYSPTVAEPAFEPVGELMHLPALRVPGRTEYRVPLGLPMRVRRDLAEFRPNIVHIASPDFASHRAVSWARRRGIPVVASVHTRFETYLAYYRMSWLEPIVRALLRRLYQRCDAIVAPAQSTAAILRAQRMNRHIAIWTRGVDREQFHPGRRDREWRQRLGIADDELAVAFLGRVVIEKALDVYADTVDELKRRGCPHRAVIIGEGPARQWFEQRLPDGLFIGFQQGDDLARALASCDVLLNPSITEAFGNVTLEAMACGLPVVAAEASGAVNIVRDGVSGVLVEPGDVTGFADALEAYCRDPLRRAAHGAEGLAFARTQDWDAINASVEQVYARAIERRRRADRLRRHSSAARLVGGR